MRKCDIYYKVAKAEKHKNLKKKKTSEQQFPSLEGADFRQLTMCSVLCHSGCLMLVVLLCA